MISRQKRQKSNVKKVNLPPLAGALSSSAMFNFYERTTTYIQHVVKA